jgi:hypothetical protein
MKSKDDEAFERKRELADIRAIMDTEHGRRFMTRLLGWSRLFQLSFTKEREVTDFNEGMRNIGLRLFAELDEACPDLLLRMMAEGKDNG